MGYQQFVAYCDVCGLRIGICDDGFPRAAFRKAESMCFHGIGKAVTWV